MSALVAQLAVAVAAQNLAASVQAIAVPLPPHQVHHLAVQLVLAQAVPVAAAFHQAPHAAIPVANHHHLAAAALPSLPQAAQACPHLQVHHAVNHLPHQVQDHLGKYLSVNLTDVTSFFLVLQAQAHPHHLVHIPQVPP